MLIKGTAQQLAEMMIQISLAHYREKWAMGLEFELWEELQGAGDLLTDEEYKQLQNLSELCGGWIRMNYRQDHLEFVLMEDWLDYFETQNPYR